MKYLIGRFLLFKRDFWDTFIHFQEVSILCYHSISGAAVPTAMPPEAFAKQLEYLRKQGYTFVSIDDVLAWIDGKKQLRKAIALSFDDGYADFESAALPILERYQTPATLFVMGNNAASREALRNDIPLLAAEGLERVRNHPLVTLGYHSMSHANLSGLHGEALNDECRSSYALFAYPGGNYSGEAIQAVKELGYKAAFSIKRGLVHPKSHRHLLPRSVITSDMKLWEVRLRTSKAIDWYRMLMRIAR